MKRDELVSQAELARRIGKTAQYIAKMKRDKKLDPAIYGRKLYFRKACEILKIDPDNIPKGASKEQVKNKKYHTKKKMKKDDVKPSKHEFDEEQYEGDGKDLLDQIMKAIKNPTHKMRYEELDSLENKAKILKLYYAAEKEKLQHEKELGNLFDRESLERIISFTINTVRNSLINMPNNFAVNLEGLNKAEIKEYVEIDVNKILEELQNISKQFEEEEW